MIYGIILVIQTPNAECKQDSPPPEKKKTPPLHAHEGVQQSVSDLGCHRSRHPSGPCHRVGHIFRCCAECRFHSTNCGAKVCEHIMLHTLLAFLNISPKNGMESMIPEFFQAGLGYMSVGY